MKEPVKNALDSALEKLEAEREIERIEKELRFEEARKPKIQETKRNKDKKEIQKRALQLQDELEEEISVCIFIFLNK